MLPGWLRGGPPAREPSLFDIPTGRCGGRECASRISIHFHTSGRAKQVRNGAYPGPLAWRFACCVDDDKADKRVEKAGDVVELVERDQWATSDPFTIKTDLAGEGVGVAGNIGRL